MGTDGRGFRAENAPSIGLWPPTLSDRVSDRQRPGNVPYLVDCTKVAIHVY